MRSRYMTFVVNDEAHLLRSWYPDYRQRGVEFDPDQVWTGLEVVGIGDGIPDTPEGEPGDLDLPRGRVTFRSMRPAP